MTDHFISKNFRRYDGPGSDQSLIILNPGFRVPFVTTISTSPFLGAFNLSTCDGRRTRRTYLLSKTYFAPSLATM